MSFRRRRDEWDELISRHGAELLACGLPDFVVSDKTRLMVFLSHGADEYRRGEHADAYFDRRELTDAQLARLAGLLRRCLSDSGYAEAAERWRRIRARVA